MPDQFELEIESLALGGGGVARRKGKTVYVHFTIPGERVQVRVVRQDERTLHAEGVRLLDASADRVYPRCPHFGAGRCGRCQWQHIDYAAQLLLKQDIITDVLERVGGVKEDVVAPVIASPEAWGYNRHMTFSPAAGGSLGLPAIDERGIVPIQVCHILHPDLLELYQSLELDLQGLKRVKLQMGSDGARMIILYAREEDAPELETDLDASVNLLLPDNEPVNLVGEAHVRYTVKDRTFRVTAGSYFRANAPQVPLLVDTVLEWLQPSPDSYVLDLFAGVGVFGAFAARQAKLVTLVESYPPAVTDADANLSDLDNVDVIEGTAEEVLADLDGSYDAAVVDPPGSLSDELVDGLHDLGVERLVYVSGDVTALARDVRRLGSKGFKLRQVQPFDASPQTFYADLVALFSRSS